MSELLSVPEAAGRAGVSEKTLRNAIHEGELEAQKVGASWVIEADDLEAWVADLDENEDDDDTEDGPEDDTDDEDDGEDDEIDDEDDDEPNEDEDEDDECRG